MDLTAELDPFVIDYLLDRGWLSGLDLCRVAQVAKIFGEDYTECGHSLSRAGHAARRRLGDWLGLAPRQSETHLGLLVLVERSLKLAPIEVPGEVVLYLWAQNRAETLTAGRLTAAPALPLTPAPSAADTQEERGVPAQPDAPRSSAEAILLAGAELIQAAAARDESRGQDQWGRPAVPGEADSAAKATLSSAVDACVTASEQVGGGGAHRFALIFFNAAPFHFHR